MGSYKYEGLNPKTYYNNTEIFDILHFCSLKYNCMSWTHYHGIFFLGYKVVINCIQIWYNKSQYILEY